jgi:hypothetical protein
MGIFFDESDFCHCEKPDIEDGLYVIWDSTGRRLSPHWDDSSRKATVSEDPGYPDKENLLNAYYNYKYAYISYDKLIRGKRISALLCSFEDAERILNEID